MFRQNVAACCDNRYFRKGIAVFFLLMVIGGVVGALLSANAAEHAFCRDHDCSDDDVNQRAQILSFGVGLAVFISPVILMCFISCCIACWVPRQPSSSSGTGSGYAPLDEDLGQNEGSSLMSYQNNA